MEENTAIYSAVAEEALYFFPYVTSVNHCEMKFDRFTSLIPIDSGNLKSIDLFTCKS